MKCESGCRASCTVMLGGFYIQLSWNGKNLGSVFGKAVEHQSMNKMQTVFMQADT